LARGETRPVNAVVYVVIQKTRKLCVFGFDVFWKKIDPLCARRAASCINWLDRPAPSANVVALTVSPRLKGLPARGGFVDALHGIAHDLAKALNLAFGLKINDDFRVVRAPFF
jgi:hypothetical protein